MNPWEIVITNMSGEMTFENLNQANATAEWKIKVAKSAIVLQWRKLKNIDTTHN